MEELFHTAEPIVLENEIVQLKKYKSPGRDYIPAGQIQAGGEILRSELRNSLIIFGIKKNCLISGRSLLLYHFTRAIKLTIVIIMGYHCHQLHTKCYPIYFCESLVDM
jgi:hypothetical protein